MKLHVISLSVGALVGVIYGLLQVKSPAPPVIALVGLLGMLGGEQAVVLVRHTLQPIAVLEESAPARGAEP